MAAVLLPSLSAASQPFARWPDAALTLVVGAGLAQIAAVQATVWARRYDTVPQDLQQWWPGEVVNGRPTMWLRGTQHSHMQKSERWSNRARGAYHAGILLLLAGVTTMVIPPGRITGSRWTLIAVAMAGLVGEFAWVVGASFLDPLRRRAALAHLGVAVTALAGLIAAVVSIAPPVVAASAAMAVAAANGSWAVLGTKAGGAHPCLPRRMGGREALAVHSLLGVALALGAVLLVALPDSAPARLLVGGATLAGLGVEAGYLHRLYRRERADDDENNEEEDKQEGQDA